jgi:nucleolar protein 53
LPSDALFTTDATGSGAIHAQYNQKHKLLKADQILALRSAIPAVESHKRSGGSPNVTNGIVPKKRRTNNVSHREYHRLRKIAYGGESVYKDVVKANGAAAYDPWEEKPVVKPKEFDFLEEKQPVVTPATLRHEPVSLAANGRQVKAVRRPAQEKSYNPTADDWVRRFDREGQKEVDAERKRLDAEEKEREKQERIAKAQEEEEQEKQWDSEWESEWEGIASGPEDAPEWSTKKRPERKTKTQRNKIKRRKEEEALKKHEAKEKIKRQQAEQLKAISKQVQENERLRQEKLLSTALVPADDSSDDSEDVPLKRIQPFGKAPYVCPNRDWRNVLTESGSLTHPWNFSY